MLDDRSTRPLSRIVPSSTETPASALSSPNLSGCRIGASERGETIMGLRERRREVKQEQAEREERDASPEEQWEYLARNLDKVAGMALETDFNQHGRKGWEFVAEAKGYAIFKRRVPT